MVDGSLNCRESWKCILIKCVLIQLTTSMIQNTRVVGMQQQCWVALPSPSMIDGTVDLNVPFKNALTAVIAGKHLSLRWNKSA
jgi:hypothetical protein